MSVHAKLMEARIKLQNSKINKTGWNPYSEFKYFEMGDFLPAIQTIFHELKLCGVVSFNLELAKLTITDWEDGTALEITSPFGSAKLKASHEIQNIGACESYGRRYLWMAAMEIVEHDAIDASKGAEEKAPETKSSAPITPNTAGKDFWNEAEPEEKEFLNKCLGTIRDLLNAGEMRKATDFFYNVGDTEGMAAVWAKLSAQERKIIKAHKVETK